MAAEFIRDSELPSQPCDRCGGTMYPIDRQETSGEDGEASYLAWHCYECDHVVCVPESGSATVQEAEEIAQALEAQYKIEKGDEAYFEASEE